MSTRNIVIKEITEVAGQLQVSLPPLNDDLKLVESGLNSLFFAILIARLEDATGSDPFATAKASDFPQTLGELIAFYETVHV